MKKMPEDAGGYNAQAVIELAGRFRAQVDESSSLSDVESSLLALANAVVRVALGDVMQERASFAEFVSVGEKLYRQHQPGHAKYHSLSGPIEIERWTYRLVGVRNGPTIVPFELREGILENATPALGYAVALGYAKAPIRSVLADLKAAHRLPPSRATLERMGKRFGARAKAAIDPIEDEIREEEVVPPTTTGITLGLDRTSVPMEEVDESSHAKTKPRVAVHYRMAYVGTVALTNSNGDVLASYRYAIGAHEDPAQITTRMMKDLARVLAVHPNVHIGIVQDGAPELWRLMDEALERAGLRSRKVHRLIDMYHLMERLSAALEISDPTDTAFARAAKLRAWKKLLLSDPGAIEKIADYFELQLRLTTRWFRHFQRTLRSEGWIPLRDHHWGLPRNPIKTAPPRPLPPPRFDPETRDKLNSLLDHYLLAVHRFRYAVVAKLGLHIGSGVTEGACKSLVTARVKRSGQRWREPGIEAVFTLRALHQCSRLPQFWSRLVATDAFKRAA